MDWKRYVTEVLQGEVASREAELAAIRNSARYRLGGWVLEAFPLRPRTILVLFRLLRFYMKRRRCIREASPVREGIPRVEGMQGATIVFGVNIPEGLEASDVWVTDVPELFARRLDEHGPVGTLVIREVAPTVLRCLERARLEGWRVEWLPEFADDADPAMVAYVRAHADHSAPEAE